MREYFTLITVLSVSKTIFLIKKIRKGLNLLLSVDSFITGETVNIESYKVMLFKILLKQKKKKTFDLFDQNHTIGVRNLIHI